MARSSTPGKTRRIQPSRPWDATQSRRFVSGIAILLLVIVEVGLTAAVSFGQAENPRQPASAIAPQLRIPLIRYPEAQIAAQRPVTTPSESTASEVIPAPPMEETFLVAPITTVTTDIRNKETPEGKNNLPSIAASAKFYRRIEMSYAMHRPGAAGIWYAWDSPATCNNPLYFEDANLERHGYSPRYLRAFQPVVSGAEFFATIPSLPYQMVATPPCECVYTLGEYRPGDCVPYQINYPPWSAAGGIVEAGAAVGLAFLIP